MSRRTAALALVLLAACSSQPVEQAIHAWVSCDECVGGELERLKAKGNAAVADLVTAWIGGPTAAQLDNIRAQVAADRAAAERFRSQKPLAVSAAGAAVPIDSASYVGRFLSAYTEGFRRRALQGLGVINTSTAIDSIKAVWKRDSLSPFPWGPGMHELARAYSHGVTGITLMPIPTKAPAQVHQAVVYLKARPGVPSVVTWMSGNAAIMTTSPTGQITAVGVGTTYLSACVSGLSAMCATTPVRVQ